MLYCNSVKLKITFIFGRWNGNRRNIDAISTGQQVEGNMVENLQPFSMGNILEGSGNRVHEDKMTSEGAERVP